LPVEFAHDRSNLCAEDGCFARPSITFDFLFKEFTMSRLFQLVSLNMVLLVEIAWCGEVRAQPNPSPAPRPGGGFAVRGVSSPFVLLGSDAVAKELNLTADQKAGIKKISDELRADLFELYSVIRDSSPTDRQAKILGLYEKAQAKRQVAEKAIAALLQEDQVKRLREIYIQVRGAEALRDPAIQAALGLSDDQKKKLQSPLEILTDEQKSAFAAMRGATFDIGLIQLGEPAPPPARP
jgi:hypothetical protein